MGYKNHLKSSSVRVVRVLDELLHLGDAGGAAHQHDLVHLPQRKTNVVSGRCVVRPLKVGTLSRENVEKKHGENVKIHRNLRKIYEHMRTHV